MKYLGVFMMLNLCFITHAFADLRDPTQPAMSSSSDEISPGEETYNLQSILVGPMRRMAMINGELASIGTKIQGARVIAIDKNHVVLWSAGHKIILHLFGRRLWNAH
jgi:type IV secretory pathway TrbD component